MKPLKLKVLVEELDEQFEEFSKYYNKTTGDITTVSFEDISIAEDSDEDDDFSNYPEWQRENIREALDVVINDENYIGLPNRHDINEYDIMEKFCAEMGHQELFDAIRGRGAFRRFKDKIVDLGVEKEWYSYKEKALSEIAKEWCEKNGIAIDEQL